MRPTFPAQLVLDVQALQSEMHWERGIARYVRMLCKHLLPHLDSIEAFCLNPNRPYPKNMEEDLLCSGKLAWGNMAPIRRAAAKGPVVYWRMSPFEMSATPDDSIHPRNILGSGALVAAILYDLIPLMLPDVYLGDPAVKLRYMHHVEMLKQADLLLSISRSAKADAVRKLGYPADQIAVIHGGVSEFFNDSDSLAFDGDVLNKVPEVSRPYLFTVLGEDPRKNLDGLIKAYSLLPAKIRNEHQLVVGGTYREAAVANIRGSVPAEIGERLVFPSYVDDYTMRALYRNCALFVFPSKYEGFGLPLLEALACGATAISSNSSSIPEIMDLPESTFDPENPEEMATLIELGLADRAFARKIREVAKVRVPMFLWPAVAEASIKAIETTMRRTTRNCRPMRPAVAMVGPFPPQRSGVADYNFYIAKEMARFVDLFIFHVGAADTESLWSSGVVDVHPIERLGTEFCPEYFDRVLYTLGNSDHHIATYDKFLEYPGILWLHDVHLLGLYNLLGTRASGNGGPFLLERAKHVYRHRCPPPVHNPGNSLWDDLDQWGAHYVAELASHAHGVIVHSRMAYEMLRLDCGSHIVLPPTHIIPLPTKKPGYTDNPRTSLKSTPHSVISLGWVTTTKLPDLLIRAFAELPRGLEAELVFVGGCDAALKDQLTGLARQLGVAHAVQFVGYVDETHWFEQIRQATCAVQLRTKSNGESSGAVLDCVSLGLPVITNVGSCREMPDNSIVKVPLNCTVRELTEHLLELFTNEDLQLRIREGALEYAEAHTFEQAARRLLSALFGVRGGWEGDTRFPPFFLPAQPPPLQAQLGDQSGKSLALNVSV